jgi:ribosome-binding factor A
VRAGELIRQEMGRLLEENSARDPRLYETMITVTDARVSADLAYVKVYVSVFSDDESVQARALAGLRSASGLLRRELGARIRLKSTPEIRFFLDHSIANGARIEALLKEIAETDREAGDNISETAPEPPGS